MVYIKESVFVVVFLAVTVLSASLIQVLQLTNAEIQTIAQAFKAKSFTTFQANGVLVAGIKYQFLRVDSIVLAKKKDFGAISMQSTNSAVVIAHTKEGMPQGISNKAVSTTADYLTSNGY